MPAPRRVFRVALSANASSEINFKELARALDAPIVDSSAQLPPLAPVPPPTPAATGPPLVGPRSQRYNIIERLEKRYGGGAVIDCSENAGANGTGGGGGRGGDEDDYYDSEDSFIDDEELQQNIEDIHGQARVKTKHTGFFVNAGDEIETLERDDTDDVGDASTKQRKKSRKGGMEASPSSSSSKSVKGYLDEWAEAASDWSPEPAVLTKMEALRAAVRELEQAAPITKVFPRKLDDALRAVDVLVVDAHPNKWRVNGYFATLMTFLPFTKQYLKSNMLRLEARDTALKLKDDLERAFVAVSELIAVHVKRTESAPVEQVKEAVTHDRDLAEKLHHLLSVQDEWVIKENDYRQMLKTEDKKHLKEQDYAALNPRQEKNRSFNRVLTLFSPPGLMDLPTLRGLNKAAKSKPLKKPAAPAAVVAPSQPTKSTTTTATTTTATTTTTPTPKASVAAPAPAAAPTGAPAGAKRKHPTAPLPSPTLVKKGIKPFKSRMMDDVPAFNAQDFEEIE